MKCSSLIILAFTLFSCTKMPVVCFTSTAPDSNVLKQNTTVLFNASCSKHADTYEWNFVDSFTNKIVHNFFADTARFHSYTFKDTGTYRIRLTGINNDKKGATTEKIFSVTP